MRRIVLPDLDHHRGRGRPGARRRPAGEPARTPAGTRCGGRSVRVARLAAAAHRALADDAIDAVRLVRAADALRQRGTTLRTSAGYEIFIDTDSGDAVSPCARRPTTGCSCCVWQVR